MFVHVVHAHQELLLSGNLGRAVVGDAAHTSTSAYCSSTYVRGLSRRRLLYASGVLNLHRVRPGTTISGAWFRGCLYLLRALGCS